MGRGRELEQLREAASAAAAGRRTLVELRGEPGIGRRRLAAEAAARLPATLVLRARARRGATYVPYATWRTLLRSVPPGPGRAEVTALAEQLAMPTPELATALPKRVEQLLEGLGAAREGAPCALIVEDLEYADPSSLALLRAVMADARPLAVLAIVTASPELSSSWAAPARPRTIALEPLDARERLQLARELLATCDDAPALAAVAADRAGGSPRAIAHVCQALLEGSEELRSAARAEALLLDARDVLPRAFDDILAGRLRRLPRDRQRLLALAALFQEPLDAATLRALGAVPREPEQLSVALHELVARGLLERHGERHYEVADTDLREAAVELLPAAERASVHRACAELLSATSGGEDFERSARIGNHYARAGVRDRALEFLTAAGASALALGACAEAAASLRQAWSLAEAAGEALAPAAHARLGLRYATALNTLDRHREAAAVLDAFDPSDLDADDLLAAGSLSIQLGWTVFDGARDAEAASARIERGLSLLDGKPEADGQVGLALAYLARVETLDGRIERALARCDRLLSETTRRGNALGQVVALTYAADASCDAGRLERAHEQLRHAREIAERDGGAFARALAHVFSARLAVLRGEIATALAQAELGREAAELAGDPEGVRAHAVIWGSYALIARGEADEAVRRLRAIVEQNPWSPSLLDHLARAELAAGAVEAATERARRALEMAPAQLVQLRAGRTLGLALSRMQPRRGRDAEREASIALALAERLDLRPHIAEAHLALAEILWRSRDREPAGAHLVAATDLLRACGMPEPPPGFFTRLAG